MLTYFPKSGILLERSESPLKGLLYEVHGEAPSAAERTGVVLRAAAARGAAVAARRQTREAVVRGAMVGGGGNVVRWMDGS